MSSVDSLDWMESKTTEDIIDRVTLGLHPGAIILCHNNGTYTADAIDTIIPYAQAQGYTFVPIGELIYKGSYQTNQQGMEEKPTEQIGDSTVKTDENAVLRTNDRNK